MKADEVKEIEISGKWIRYWYLGDFDGDIDSSDVEHIKECLADGFIEGGLETPDYDGESFFVHSGWWKKV
jgi:hypothetical protein